MKKVLVVLMVVVMAFAMTACGGNNTGEEGKMINVCIEIDYPDVAGMPDVEDYKFQIAEGSTALDMLVAYAEAANIEILMSDTSQTAYVTSIGGVAETADAGWVYEIDDQMTMDAADQYVVKAGDEITWEFMSWNDMD